MRPDKTKLRIGANWGGTKAEEIFEILGEKDANEGK